MIVFRVVIKDARIEREVEKISRKDVADAFRINSATWLRLRGSTVSASLVKSKKRKEKKDGG